MPFHGLVILPCFPESPIYSRSDLMALHLAIQPSYLLEAGLLTAGRILCPFRLPLYGMAINHSLAAAARLSLFTILQSEALSLVQLLQETGYDSQGLGVLQETLWAFEVLNYRHGEYRHTTESTRWFTPASGVIAALGQTAQFRRGYSRASFISSASAARPSVTSATSSW